MHQFTAGQESATVAEAVPGKTVAGVVHEPLSHCVAFPLSPITVHWAEVAHETDKNRPVDIPGIGRGAPQRPPTSVTYQAGITDRDGPSAWREEIPTAMQKDTLGHETDVAPGTTRCRWITQPPATNVTT